MSVLIKGMEMPKSCYDCPLQDDECFGSIKCGYAKTWGSARMRAVDCPLVPVPEHGDLIDRDKLREKEFIHDGDAYAVVMSRDIRNAPTIIPAELKEET